MSIQVNTQQMSSTPEQGYPTGQVTGSNLGSITAALLEIVSTMSEINSSYYEIATASMELQASFNEEQCSAIREEGSKSAMGYWAQSAASLFSGVCDGIAMGASYGKNKELNNQLKEQTNELNTLKKTQSQLTSGEEGTELKEIDSEGKFKPNSSETIEGQINAQTNAINTTQSQITNRENKYRQLSDLFKQIGNSASSALQARSTVQASDAKAEQSSTQFDQQTQNMIVQDALKAMSDNFSQMSSTLQSLTQTCSA